MSWLPIETAPKDGTRFISARSSGAVSINYWFDDAHGWNNVYFNDPMTHWMPLPALPCT